MALTSTVINISYSLGSTPPEFVFTDVTDYVAQNVNISNIRGVIVVTAPSGVVYTGGNPDINGGLSRINSTTIPVPLLADGSPEVGDYSFTYTATDLSTTPPTTTAYRIDYNFKYVSPTGILTPTVDCLSPKLTSTDATNYLSGSTTPTNQFNIIGVSTATDVFTIAGEKSGLFSVGDTFNVIGSTGNDGKYKITKVASNVSITGVLTTELTVDCDIPSAVVDGKISTKTNTIHFPTNQAPLIGYDSVLTTSNFYNKTQLFKVVTKSFYDFGFGISVVDVVSSSSELDIDCDVRLCEVFCCVNSTLKAYLAYRGVNDVLANQELNKYILATSHLSALRQAFECGYDKDINSIVQEIMTVTQCTPDCSCSDTTPQPITGLGAANITVVNATGNGVVVTPTTVGNTTTYSLGISQALLDSITVATATSSVTSSDGTVTINTFQTGNNKTYNLSIPAPAPAIAPVEFMNFKLKRDPIAGASSALFVLSDQVIQNASNLKTPTFTTNASGQSGNHYELTITNFQTTPNTTFKAEVQCSFQGYRYISGLYDTTSIYYNVWITPEIIKINSGEIKIKFTDKNNLFVYNGNMPSYHNMHLNIKIYE